MSDNKKTTKKGQRSKPKVSDDASKQKELISRADDNLKATKKEKTAQNDLNAHDNTQTQAYSQVNEETEERLFGWADGKKESSSRERAIQAANNQSSPELQQTSPHSKLANCGCETNSVCGCNDIITQGVLVNSDDTLSQTDHSSPLHTIDCNDRTHNCDKQINNNRNLGREGQGDCKCDKESCDCDGEKNSSLILDGESCDCDNDNNDSDNGSCDCDKENCECNTEQNEDAKHKLDCDTIREESLSPQAYDTTQMSDSENGQGYTSKSYSDVYSDASAVNKPLDKTLGETLFDSQGETDGTQVFEAKSKIDANDSTTFTSTSSTQHTYTSSERAKAPDSKKASLRKSDGNGLFVLAILVGVAAMLIALALGNSSSLANATATLKCDDCRLGQTAIFTAQLSQSTDKFKSDTKVIWSINGKEVKKVKIGDKDALKLEYTPENKGEVTVGLKVGDYGNLTKSQKINVKNPLLTIRLDDKTMTYGDKLPELTYKTSGYLSSDTADSIGLKVLPSVDTKTLDAGSYTVTATTSGASDYDIEIKTGRLEVKPRTIKLVSPISKVYDGSTDCNDCIKSPIFDELITGDELILSGSLTFKDKNAGDNKALNVSSLKLEGEKSGNYILDTKGLTGTITPKLLTLSELSAADKIYDGTANVTFKEVGNLSGTISGDRVTIAEISARFENNAIGKDKTIIIDEIKLIGDDSKNYTVSTDISVSASILPLSQAQNGRRPRPRIKP